MGLIYDSGPGPTTSIVNGFSAGGVTPVVLPAPPELNLKETLSGAVTGGTFVTILNITGRGQLNFAAVKTKDATLRTVSLKITIDGTVAFNAASGNTANSDRGIVGVGCWSSSTSTGHFQPEPFYSSLKLEITQSLSETDKISALYNYVVWAS